MSRLIAFLAVLLRIHARPSTVVEYSDDPIDLSYPFNEDTVYWPNLYPLNLNFSYGSVFAGQTEKGYYYRSKWFKTAEHGGTHMDAPSHFAEKGLDVSQLPLSSLQGPLVVLNVSAETKENSDYRISLADLDVWKGRCGNLPFGSFIIMFSNWGVRWPNKELVFGSKTPSNLSSLHFPGFGEETVRVLIEQYHIKGVGVDTPSTDCGQSTDFKVHQLLAKHNLVGLENVANLHLLADVCHAKLIATPMKVSAGSGAPARLIACKGNVKSTSSRDFL